jgi:molybdopterin molybdotransferase
MISVAQAQSKLLQLSNAELKTERLALRSALGKVASQDVISSLDIPPSDNSAMDGFAVCAAEVSNGANLTISQRVPAGSQPRALITGTAARIFTGGVMPAGSDAVVIQENCVFDTDSVTVNKEQVRPGDNVRPQGQDIPKGAIVVHKGQKLSAVDLSLLASIGHAEVEVYQKLKVAIFSTGDELIEPGQTLQAGQIYNSNRVLLMALCDQLGFAAVDCGIVEDTLNATKQALASAADQADLIISSGGVSVGEEDHVKPAVEALGSLAMWKVQMKPGKPVAFGDVAGTPILGLPGNPVSSFIVFQLLGVPLARALQGQLSSLPSAYSVQAGFDMKASTREEYIRVRLERNEVGVLVAHRFANLSSGVMSSLSWADGLVRHDIDQIISEGDQIAFLPLTESML